VARIALWRNEPVRADDWIWAIDLVLHWGGGKCLVIGGVRRSQLRGGDFALRHTDVSLLYAEVMSSSTGESLLKILEALAQTIGRPLEIVADHGSDVLKAKRLFQARHSQVKLVWDCTHRHARLLLATSDVLESLFGKYKRYTERGPENELNSSILTLPLATVEVTNELIEESLKNTPIKHLTAWCQATLGKTKLAITNLLNHLTPAKDSA